MTEYPTQFDRLIDAIKILCDHAEEQEGSACELQIAASHPPSPLSSPDPRSPGGTNGSASADEPLIAS